MLPHKSEAELKELLQNAKILEHMNKKGKLKVAELPDGRILKLFRKRGFTFTSNIRKPYCLTFKENAERLIQMGIPSIVVEDVFYLPHLENYAVLYPLLPGTSLRNILQAAKPEARKELLERIAVFVAQLHEKGIYFRSLHLGNVLITESGAFGLIDVTDIDFHERALKISERRRNFEHITRYQKDIDLLTHEQPGTFIEAYLKETQASAHSSAKLRLAFEAGCKNPKLK